MKIKRFVLFSGPIYESIGGWQDFRGSFDVIEQAKDANVPHYHDWRHIVDLDTGDIIAKDDDRWIVIEVGK